MAYGKEWMRKYYGATCKLIGGKEYDSSTTLHKDDIPQDVKDAGEYLSVKLRSSKQDRKPNVWNLNAKINSRNMPSVFANSMPKYISMQ